MTFKRLLLNSGEINNTIPEYFAGKNVFITGSTGFMGKMLLEKLLLECPDIGTIYLLIRPGRGKSIHEKLKMAVSNPLFDKLRTKDANMLNKLVPINGDITKLNLGLSLQDEQEISEKVSIVYHIAASVRFDLPLNEAVLLNVRGTRELCNLAINMKKLEVLTHVSTAYCQLDKKDVYETTYAAKGNWREAIKIAEDLDAAELALLSEKYIGHFPNTYTFTKSLSEALINDLCKGNIPAVIVRPTIVTPAFKGSYPGWCDNFNGPIGLLTGQNKGIIRSTYYPTDVCYDLIPVDVVVNSMVKATWMQQYLLNDEISVYNCTSHNKFEVNYPVLHQAGVNAMETVIIKPVWHATLYTTDNRLLNYINIILFHFIPAIIFDFILWISGKKPMLQKLQRRVFTAANALEYFRCNSWNFHNDKCFGIDDYLLESDRAAFYDNLYELNFNEYVTESVRVAQILLLKEDPGKSHIYKQQRIRLKYIHFVMKYTSLAVLWYWLLNYFMIPVAGWFMDYLSSF